MPIPTFKTTSTYGDNRLAAIRKVKMSRTKAAKFGAGDIGNFIINKLTGRNPKQEQIELWAHEADQAFDAILEMVTNLEQGMRQLGDAHGTIEAGFDKFFKRLYAEAPDFSSFWDGWADDMKPAMDLVAPKGRPYQQAGNFILQQLKDKYLEIQQWTSADADAWVDEVMNGSAAASLPFHASVRSRMAARRSLRSLQRRYMRNVRNTERFAKPEDKSDKTAKPTKAAAPEKRAEDEQ